MNNRNRDIESTLPLELDRWRFPTTNNNKRDRRRCGVGSCCERETRTLLYFSLSFCCGAKAAKAAEAARADAVANAKSEKLAAEAAAAEKAEEAKKREADKVRC